jgi:hypothetical protein
MILPFAALSPAFHPIAAGNRKKHHGGSFERVYRSEGLALFALVATMLWFMPTHHRMPKGWITVSVSLRMQLKT